MNIIEILHSLDFDKVLQTFSFSSITALYAYKQNSHKSHWEIQSLFSFSSFSSRLLSRINFFSDSGAGSGSTFAIRNKQWKLKRNTRLHTQCMQVWIVSMRVFKVELLLLFSFSNTIPWNGSAVYTQRAEWKRFFFYANNKLECESEQSKYRNGKQNRMCREVGVKKLKS